MQGELYLEEEKEVVPVGSNCQAATNTEEDIRTPPPPLEMKEPFLLRRRRRKTHLLAGNIGTLISSTFLSTS